MRIIESRERHEEEWKLALGEVIYEFGSLEARMTLMCSLFMEPEKVKKVPFSEKVDRAIVYCKKQFSGRSDEVVSVLVEFKKAARFRNAVVHGSMQGYASMLGVHPTRIETDSLEQGSIFLEDVQSAVVHFKALKKRMNSLDRELGFFSLEKAVLASRR